MKATLAIGRTGDDLVFSLEGVGPRRISVVLSNLDEYVQLIRHGFVNKLDERDWQILEEMIEYTAGDMNLDAQQDKVFVNTLGSIIYKRLLPEEITSSLSRTDISYLSMDIDDSLVDVPWEMAYTDEGFLCLKYATSREIPVDQVLSESISRTSEIRFLLIEDPTGTLSSAGNEINYLVGNLLRLPKVKINRAGMQMRKRDFLDLIVRGGFDVLHFSGHGNFDEAQPENSSLSFWDNPCYAHEIYEHISSPPSLIFCNACTSAQMIAGQQGLAHAFMLGGVGAYIGSIQPVGDEVAAMLGSEFYRYIIHGRTVGEALRLARVNCRGKFGWSDPSWLSYVLYGDPTGRFF